MRIRATTQKSPLLIGASLKCGMPAAPSFESGVVTTHFDAARLVA
jgi:hypothetical protein